jgi:hypothetical protein
MNVAMLAPALNDGAEGNGVVTTDETLDRRKPAEPVCTSS